MSPYELWQSCRPLVRKLAYACVRGNPDYDIDDFEQSALLELWLAANRYSEEYADDCSHDKQPKFITYAMYYVRGGLRRAYEFHQKYKRDIESLKYAITDNYTLLDSAIFDDRDLLEVIISRIQGTDEIPASVYQGIARLYYLDGLDTTQIAKHLSFATTTVKRYRAHAYSEMFRTACQMKGEL